MKEHLRQIASRADNNLTRECLVREYLQARLLETLQEAGAFLHWAFLGGTALRFLYGLPRFSEDLDFSIIAPGGETGLKTAMAEVKRVLTLEGYLNEIKINDKRAVASARVRFPGLPLELGLSPHSDQTLSIKIELDTKPPAGAKFETSVVRQHVTLHLCHHDKASLLAGKLHAILVRSWPKGRDLYDLAWYLADRTWPPPNLDLLNAALAQNLWQGPRLTKSNWKRQLRQRLSMLDWSKARADVMPFLEGARDLDLVNKDAILRLLE